MHDIRFIRENPAAFDAGLARRGAPPLSAEILAADASLRALQTEATAPVYLTVYAPWIADDNFMLGIKTVAETLGFSADKLRLRG